MGEGVWAHWPLAPSPIKNYLVNRGNLQGGPSWGIGNFFRRMVRG